MIRLLAIFAVLCMSFLAHARGPDDFWSSRVEPLLDKQCLKCHAGVHQKGGLDLRSLETILRGGERGPAIIPGKPDESHLVQFVLAGADPHMPSVNKKQLRPDEIAILRAWVAQLPVSKSKLASGSSTNNTWVPGYLADYQRIHQSHEIPPAKLPTSATIDWFLKRDRRRDKIKPAGLCDDLAFARRIYLDVAGRIPSNDELQRFLKDSRRNKRAELGDQLLASDEYPR
ncbi:MAG: hypothetical protein JWM99_2253, partial [Verrucomicrobiales bacterium]|nr:hypothetical protein [Verrucomicrobiales bacterium]